MTIEFIFAVVTAVITAVLGTLFKDGVVPARFIPIQNLAIGTIAVIVSVSMGLFDNYGIAILISYGMSLGVGGAYDAVQTKSKE